MNKQVIYNDRGYTILAIQDSGNLSFKLDKGPEPEYAWCLVYPEGQVEIVTDIPTTIETDEQEIADALTSAVVDAEEIREAIARAEEKYEHSDKRDGVYLVSVTLNTRGDAFKGGNFAHEVEQMLRSAGERLRSYSGGNGDFSLFDTNGARAGRVIVTGTDYIDLTDE